MIFYASLISLTYAVQNISENHYVLGESFTASVYSRVAYGNTIIPTKVDDADSGVISYASLDEIPKEVILPW